MYRMRDIFSHIINRTQQRKELPMLDGIAGIILGIIALVVVANLFFASFMLVLLERLNFTVMVLYLTLTLILVNAAIVIGRLLLPQRAVLPEGKSRAAEVLAENWLVTFLVAVAAILGFVSSYQPPNQRSRREGIRLLFIATLIPLVMSSALWGFLIAVR